MSFEVIYRNRKQFKYFVGLFPEQFHHFKDLRSLMLPPPRTAFREKVPAVFKKFKNIRCIVDCTELFCEVPRDYGRQGNVWSHTSITQL